MTSQTDKFFQKKLENYQRSVPAGAWDRIESNLDKTNSTTIWLKIAAAVAFLAVATFILWPTSSTNKPGVTKIETQEKIPVKADVQKIIPPTADLNKHDNQPLTSREKIIHIKKRINSGQSSENLKEQQARKISEPTSTEILPVETVATIEVPSPAAVASTTIVYTAEEVNSKYLRKKNQADATEDEKKTSGMQKLIGLAYALKNNDNGLSDLRQKKDEILALNFLTEDKNNKEKN